MCVLEGGVLALHLGDELTGFFFGDFVGAVLVPWEGEVLVERCELGSHAVGYCEAQQAGHVPMFTSATTVALDYCVDFP